jgi:predicted transcriptional regulator
VSATSASRTKKLIAFRPEQVEALDEIAAETGETFTALIGAAVDDYIAAHDKTTQQILDRIVATNAGLLERLRDA